MAQDSPYVKYLRDFGIALIVEGKYLLTEHTEDRYQVWDDTMIEITMAEVMPEYMDHERNHLDEWKDPE